MLQRLSQTLIQEKVPDIPSLRRIDVQSVSHEVNGVSKILRYEEVRTLNEARDVAKAGS